MWTQLLDLLELFTLTHLAIVVCIALFVLGAYVQVQKRLGNGGERRPCCLCHEPGFKYIPVVGRSFWDAVFQRSRRVEAVPWTLVLSHDYDSERRLCRSCYAGQCATVEAAMEDERSRRAKDNRAALLKLQAITVDRPAPEPLPETVREKQASEIELKIDGGAG